MNDVQIALLENQQTDNHAVLLPADITKDHKYRLKLYADYLTANGQHWLEPDLNTYSAFLKDVRGLSPATIKAHLSTIRSRYRTLLRETDTRNHLYALTPSDAAASDRKAFVDEITERVRNAIDPDAVKVDTFTEQDRPDSLHLRLTAGQANMLMKQPGISTLRGLRDTAIISLLLCTGLREAELCALDVSDLRQHLDGELALYVRSGKGRKKRLIPYGDLDWVLAFVDAWLSQAGITEGAVFRGFYKGNQRLRDNRISVRTVEYILASYPITISGERVHVRPHDCRRTYARRLYDAGVDLNRIRQNLAHSSIDTTLLYVGALDGKERRPPAIYKPPHNLTDLLSIYALD